MVEVTGKDQAVEDGDPDDFTALESIKDDLEEGMVIMKLPVQANFVLRNGKRKHKFRLFLEAWFKNSVLYQSANLIGNTQVIRKRNIYEKFLSVRYSNINLYDTRRNYNFL